MTARRVTSGELQQIRSKKREGLSVQQLARMFRRSSQTISRALQEVRALSAAPTALPSAPVKATPSDGGARLIEQPSLALRMQLPSQKAAIPLQVPASAVVDVRAAEPEVTRRTTRAANGGRKEQPSVRLDVAQTAAPARASKRVQRLEAPTSGSTSNDEQTPATQPSSTASTCATPTPAEQISRDSSSHPPLVRQELPVAAPTAGAPDASTLPSPCPPVSSTQAHQLHEASARNESESGSSNRVTTVSPGASDAPAPTSTSVLLPAAPASTASTESNPSAAPIIRPFMRPPRVLPFVRSTPPNMLSSNPSGSITVTTPTANAVSAGGDSAAARPQDPGPRKTQELQRIVSSLQARVRNLQQEQVGDDGGKLCDLLAHFRDEVLDLGISTDIGDRKRKRDEDADNIELGKLLREKIVAEVSLLRAQAERERVQLARDRLEVQVDAALSRKRLEAASVSKATADRIFANAMVV